MEGGERRTRGRGEKKGKKRGNGKKGEVGANKALVVGGIDAPDPVYVINT